jgi:hypothetical protein
MKTTATNKKIRVLITGIRNKTKIPDPEFQRRLVWTNKDKINFLDTVLNGYPFPEIYIAAGDVDPDTGEGTELLVDGQQRITTLYQYFIGSSELRLGKDIQPYAELNPDKKMEFLEYDVVVRDLGQLSIEEIKRVFQKINATSYALNTMEIHNARFDGKFKKFAEEISDLPFFDNHRIFSANDIRRMNDLRFVLTLIITIMSTYFSRDEALEEYLTAYNDEFELEENLRDDINEVLLFIEKCEFGSRSRVWKITDLLNLVVELHRLIISRSLKLERSDVAKRLEDFYYKVDNYSDVLSYLSPQERPDIGDYQKAVLQGTNDRISRARRGEIIRKVIISDELPNEETTSTP